MFSSISLKLFCFVILFNFAYSVNESFWNQVDKDDKFIIEKWNKFSAQNFNLDLFTFGMSSKLEEILNSTKNISETCSESLFKLRNDAKGLKSYAIKALDSWGRYPPSGFTQGTFTSLGEYDECLKFDNLQYCTVLMRPILPRRDDYANFNTKPKIIKQYKTDQESVLNEFIDRAQLFYYTAFRLGICLPKTCSKQEIASIANTVTDDLGLMSQLGNCDTNDDFKFEINKHVLVSIICIGIIVFLSLFGSLLDLKQNSQFVKTFLLPNPTSEQLILSFSIKKNFKKLFETKTKDDELNCLNGIRFLSIFLIMVQHLCVWNNHYFFSKMYNNLKLLNNFPLQFLLNGFFFVDTFFFLSGLLTSYTVLKKTNGNYKKFNISLFLIYRFLRLTPGVIFANLGFFILPYLGNGPFFKEVTKEHFDNCKNNWHLNLLYLQTNLESGDGSKICNLPGWWLSTEMKLHFLSFFFVILMFAKTKLAYFFNFIFILSAISWAYIENFKNDYPAHLFLTLIQSDEFFIYLNEYLYKIHIHLGPCFIGLITGHMIAKKKGFQTIKKYNLIGWLFVSFLFYLVFYSPYPWVLEKSQPNIQWLVSLYASTSQTLWSLILSWVVLNCYINNNLILNKFLSLSIFRPLSRIVYMTYLTHTQIIIHSTSVRRNLVPLEIPSIIIFTSERIIFIILYGIISTILVESPVLNLLNLCLKKINQQVEDKNNNLLNKKKNNEINMQNQDSYVYSS